MAKYLCVLDFEANCAKNMEELNMDNEVIEFPSVLWKYEKSITKDPDDEKKFKLSIKMEKLGEFQMFCKPKNTPKLTKFCIDLTKITQDKVDSGVAFPTALKNHELWLRSKIPDFDNNVFLNNIMLVTCGDWDMKTMAPKEYKNYNIRNVHQFYLRYINIKREFFDFYNFRKQLGMSGMLNYLRLPLDGTHHSGIDDCKNISKILIRLFEDGHEFEKMKVNRVFLK